VQFFPSRLRFPNGEALREVQFRAVQILETLSARHENDTIVVVSHADLIKLVVAHYLGVHIDLFQRIVISPASITILGLANNGLVRVVRLNDDGPLQGPEGSKKDAQRRKKKLPRLRKISMRRKLA
jgi:probable phosphoglycerate mutase